MLGSGALGQFALGQFANFLAVEAVTAGTQNGVAGGLKKRAKRKQRYEFIDEGIGGGGIPEPDVATVLPQAIPAALAITPAPLSVANQDNLAAGLMAQILAEYASQDAERVRRQQDDDRIRQQDDDDEDLLLLIAAT